MKHSLPDLRSYLRSRIFLRFDSDELEELFVKDEFQSKIILMKIAGIFGVILIAGFYPFDRIFMPKEALDITHALRLMVLVPLAVLMNLFIFFSRNIALIRWVNAIGIMIIGLAWPFLLWKGGPQTTIYFYPAIIMTFMYAYSLLGIAFRIAVVIAWSMTITAIATIASIGSPIEVFLNSAIFLWAICSITTLGTYSLEWVTRSFFVVTLTLNEEFDRQLAKEHQRTRWLELIAGFLRHELKNSMIGVSSSVDLINRRNSNPIVERYLDRAKKSIQFMRRVLQQASNATSLEEALQYDEKKQVNLSSLLSDHIKIFRDEYPRFEFDLVIQPGIEIRGSADGLIQMVQKLLNNAIEHAETDSRIGLVLETSGTSATLTIRNIGDSLPSDTESVFVPFSSSKVKKGTDNMGLGLYVARVIAEYHDGVIVGKSLVEPSGAEFTVTLPTSNLLIYQS